MTSGGIKMAVKTVTHIMYHNHAYTGGNGNGDFVMEWFNFL
jgi:hypothetical protein